MTFVFIAAAWLAGIFTPRIYNSAKAAALGGIAKLFRAGPQ